MNGAPVLVFVHGWAFGPEVWDGVRESLNELDTVAIDLGFTGDAAMPSLPQGRSVVAIECRFLELGAREARKWSELSQETRGRRNGSTPCL